MSATPPNKVKLGDREVELVVPNSAMVRHEVWYASARNLERAACAALGVCWGARAVWRPKARYLGEPLPYGGQVFEELLARGIPAREINGAAYVALNLLTAGLYTEEEVEAEMGNSEDQPDGSPTTD